MAYTQKELENIRKAQCLGLATEIILKNHLDGRVLEIEHVIKRIIETAEEFYKELKEKKYFTD